MGERQSIDKSIELAQETLVYAEEQLYIGQLQEHHNDVEYSEAQQLIETAMIELEKLEGIATPEQKEELYRMRLQLQQLQSKMIITPH